jgi:hypothetical protein
MLNETCLRFLAPTKADILIYYTVLESFVAFSGGVNISFIKFTARNVLAHIFFALNR